MRDDRTRRAAMGNLSRNEGAGRRYLVADYGFGHSGHVVTAAWVHAESAEEAARMGRDALEAEIDDGNDGYEYPGNVVVVDASAWTWFTFEHTPRLAELQCCGGADTADGHTGHCELRGDAA